MRHMKHLTTRFITIETRRCTACWECVEECPKGVIGRAGFWGHKHAHIDEAEACVGCKKCIKACPHQAILEHPRLGSPVSLKTDALSRQEWERNVLDLLR